MLEIKVVLKDTDNGTEVAMFTDSKLASAAEKGMAFSVMEGLRVVIDGMKDMATESEIVYDSPSDELVRRVKEHYRVA